MRQKTITDRQNILSVMLAALAILAILAAWFSTPWLTYGVVLLAVAAAVTQLLLSPGSKLRRRLRQAQQRQDELEARCGQLQDTIGEDEKLIARLQQKLQELEPQVEALDRWRGEYPDLTSSDPLPERVRALADYVRQMGSGINVDALARALDGALQTSGLIAGLQRRVTMPYQQALHTQPDIVTAQAAHANLVLTLQAFMELFDCIDAHESINARAEQSINQALARGEIDMAQARSQALPATGDPQRTPLWMRVLCDSMRQWGITADDALVVSGYIITDDHGSAEQVD